MPETSLESSLWECGPRPPAIIATTDTPTYVILDHDQQSFDWGARCDKQLKDNRVMLQKMFDERKDSAKK